MAILTWKSNIVFENARIKEEDNHLIINTNKL